MWTFLKKSTDVLWRMIRKNPILFSLAWFSLSLAILSPLTGLFLLIAAIPLAIVIGFLSNILLGYGLVLFNFYLDTGRLILTNYADKLTNPQKKLYEGFIEIDKAAKTALEPYLLPSLQAIVFSYFTIHRMTLNPPQFNEMIRSIDVNDRDDNNGLISNEWFYQGSLSEFIQFISYQYVLARNTRYSIQEQRSLLLDLLALGFNNPDLVSNPRSNDGLFTNDNLFTKDLATTPIQAFTNCVDDSIQYEQIELLKFLFQYIKANLPDKIKDLLQHTVFLLLVRYQKGRGNLELILNTLAAEKFDTALYENTLDFIAVAECASPDPVYKQSINNFFTHVTTKLELPAIQLAIEADLVVAQAP